MPRKPKPATRQDTAESILQRISALNDEERQKLWRILLYDPKWYPAQRLKLKEDDYFEVVDKITIERAVAKMLDDKLRHHRKPARNKKRDNEILRLHSEKKSSGQIKNILAPQYPKLTANIVRAVISRNSPSS